MILLLHGEYYTIKCIFLGINNYKIQHYWNDKQK